MLLFKSVSQNKDVQSWELHWQQAVYILLTNKAVLLRQGHIVCRRVRGDDLHSYNFLFYSVLVFWCVDQETPLSDFAIKSQGICKEVKSCSSAASQRRYTEHVNINLFTHCSTWLVDENKRCCRLDCWLKMSCSQAPSKIRCPSHCHRSRIVCDLCTLEPPVGFAVSLCNTEPI